MRSLPLDDMLAWYMLSSCVRPSVRPSHAGIAPQRLNILAQVMPHDRSGTPVWWRQNSWQNSKGVTPTVIPEQGVVKLREPFTFWWALSYLWNGSCAVN